MKSFNTASLTRKAAMSLGALIVSTMTIAGASQAQAKPKFHVDLYLGSGWGGIGLGNGPFLNYCDKYWWKYKKTGKFKYKKKYMLCMGLW